MAIHAARPGAKQRMDSGVLRGQNLLTMLQMARAAFNEMR
jgi:hypothetical protein